MSLKDSKPTNRPDELRFCCPFCESKVGEVDEKYKLYANFKKGLFQCFRCGTKGAVSSLKRYFDIGGSGSVNQTSPDLNFIKDKLKSLDKRKRNPTIDLNLVSVPMTKDTTPIAYDYIKKRKFTDDEINKYQIHVGLSYTDPKTGNLDRTWSGRIIFPFFEDGKVVFLVGRSYNGSSLRYKNSVGNKDQVVYGIDKVQGECLICEGIVSAIAAERATGIPSVSILGKTISDYQLAKLRMSAHKVYVCLDGTDDVTQQSRNRLNRLLIKAGFEVYEVRPALDKDPDDMDPVEFKKCFDEKVRIKL
jgi:DNA primase